MAVVSGCRYQVSHVVSEPISWLSLLTKSSEHQGHERWAQQPSSKMTWQSLRGLFEDRNWQVINSCNIRTERFYRGEDGAAYSLYSGNKNQDGFGEFYFVSAKLEWSVSYNKLKFRGWTLVFFKLTGWASAEKQTKPTFTLSCSEQTTDYLWHWRVKTTPASNLTKVIFSGTFTCCLPCCSWAAH